MINLLIVNCQSDFISGTLGNKNSKTALDNIKKFIKNNATEIEKIVFAIEWHPYNHCSFLKNGGEYPPHCVQYTPGACIEPKLLKLVHSLRLDYGICARGEFQEETDDIGAFTDIAYVNDVLGSSVYLDTVFVDNTNDYIICGMGEKVIAESVVNLMDGNIKPKIFLQGIYSEDGGKTISDCVKIHNLEKVTI